MSRITWRHKMRGQISTLTGITQCYSPPFKLLIWYHLKMFCRLQMRLSSARVSELWWHRSQEAPESSYSQKEASGAQVLWLFCHTLLVLLATLLSIQMHVLNSSEQVNLLECIWQPTHLGGSAGDIQDHTFDRNHVKTFWDLFFVRLTLTTVGF